MFNNLRLFFPWKLLPAKDYQLKVKSHPTCNVRVLQVGCDFAFYIVLLNLIFFFLLKILFNFFDSELLPYFLFPTPIFNVPNRENF